MKKILIIIGLVLFSVICFGQAQYYAAKQMAVLENFFPPNDTITAPKKLGELRTSNSGKTFVCISLTGPMKWITIDGDTDTLYIYKDGEDVKYKWGLNGVPFTAFTDKSLFSQDGQITSTRTVYIPNSMEFSVQPNEVSNDSTPALRVTFTEARIGSFLRSFSSNDSLNIIKGRTAFGGIISHTADADLNLNTGANADNYLPYLSLASTNITANRTLTLAPGRKNGELMLIKNNNNSAFAWQFAGTPITEVDGTVLNTMPNRTFYMFVWSGAAWVKLTTGAGGGGATNLDGLTDVVITTPAQGQRLVYTGTEWRNEVLSGTFANRPATPYVGQTYYQTNLLEGRYTWDGKKWNYELDQQTVAFSSFFGGNINTLGWGFQSGTSGTGANLFSNSTFFSAYEFITGTTTTGISQARTQGNVGMVGTNGRIIYSYRVRLPVLSDGTETYTIRAGRDGADGIGFYFRYTHSLSSGQWQCVTNNGTTETATASGITVAANTWYDLLAVYDTQIGDVKFYINNTLVATNTTNLPANFSTSGWPGTISIAKSAGTTSRSMLVDEAIIKVVE